MRHIELYFPKKYWQENKTTLFQTFPQDAYVKIDEEKLEFFIEDEAQNILSIELQNALSEQEYADLEELNSELLTFETENYRKIYIRMGTFSIISAITMAIGAGLFMWAIQDKKGRVFTEEGEYKFEYEDENGEKQIIRRKPDISFISYEDYSEEKQREWNKKYIPKPATLIVEIVSSAKSLKKELAKMENIWIKHGAKLGLVICPYSKKVYIFEKGKSGYTTQSIYKKFTNPLLPGYEGDFSVYVNEVE